MLRVKRPSLGPSTQPPKKRYFSHDLLAVDRSFMFIQRLISAPSFFWRLWTEGRCTVRAWRERRKAIEDIRKTRGITLLREWLSPAQQAQFDAFRHFDVIGCDRYRIRHGTATNVYE